MRSKVLKIGKLKKYVFVFLTVAMLLMLVSAPCTFAAGTASGTDINNRATIGYSVGSVSQTPIESSPTGNSTPGPNNGADTTFEVDDRVDLTVTTVDLGPIQVAPGGSDRVLTFRVTNDGNTPHDFLLSATALGSGPQDVWGAGDVNDNFDANNVEVYADGNSNGIYEAGVDTRTWVDELAADASITVFIVVDIAASQVDGDAAVFGLVAQAAAGGGVGVQGGASSNDTGADVPGTVQIVFGDGIGTDDNQVNPDGRHSSRSAYEVASSQLTVLKTSTVVWDPINNGSNPKAIPGAFIEYTITISNDVAAGEAADAVTLTDDLSAEIAAGRIVFRVDGYSGGHGIRVTSPDIGTNIDLTNAGGDDKGDWNATTVNNVTVNCGNLDAGESATVFYQVILQ